MAITTPEWWDTDDYKSYGSRAGWDVRLIDMWPAWYQAATAQARNRADVEAARARAAAAGLPWTESQIAPEDMDYPGARAEARRRGQVLPGDMVSVMGVVTEDDPELDPTFDMDIRSLLVYLIILLVIASAIGIPLDQIPDDLVRPFAAYSGGMGGDWNLPGGPGGPDPGGPPSLGDWGGGEVIAGPRPGEGQRT